LSAVLLIVRAFFYCAASFAAAAAAAAASYGQQSCLSGRACIYARFLSPTVMVIPQHVWHLIVDVSMLFIHGL
jgi:hypothetical protein